MTPQGLDADLVEAARGGSSAAFGRLVDRHQRAVRGFLRRLCGDAAEADDLAQETFLAAWTEIGRFRGEAEVRSWLCGIAWRRHQSAARAGLRRRRRDQAWSEAAQQQGAIPASSDDRLTLERALAGLPLDQRAAVALCLAGEFSHADAAEVLGLPIGTVKSHVARGRSRLLAAIGGRDE
ncbi:RNA polymerase sigma factor [Caulobacter mirabilis]|uniref:RNA polymerase sigma factor n=1 Tax=Caulobacter mirabilis TaxID=69666 RepID=A0A2D2AZ43_9CAUL|nr:RNA polymerase sigma factor [Caulobacter mirabilis]ATQ43279.1 RNA polymerase subunit sigma-70 [Caulobacter mirabilis]